MLSHSPFNAQVNTFDLMDWPADYRMYAAQNCIIIPEKLYASYLDEPHRKALRQWVLGGGSLWLIGDRGRKITAAPLGRGLILHVPSLEGMTDKEKEAALLKLKTETKDIFPVKVDGYYDTPFHPKTPDAFPYFSPPRLSCSALFWRPLPYWWDRSACCGGLPSANGSACSS